MAVSVIQASLLLVFSKQCELETHPIVCHCQVPYKTFILCLVHFFSFYVTVSLLFCDVYQINYNLFVSLWGRESTVYSAVGTVADFETD